MIDGTDHAEFARSLLACVTPVFPGSVMESAVRADDKLVSVRIQLIDPILFFYTHYHETPYRGHQADLWIRLGSVYKKLATFDTQDGPGFDIQPWHTVRETLETLLRLARDPNRANMLSDIHACFPTSEVNAAFAVLELFGPPPKSEILT